jgi:hypothetical protein
MKLTVSQMKGFWFTILLLAVYIGIFEAWGKLKPDAVILSAAAVSVALTILLILAKRQKYFLNRWELFGHVAIIGDILLEGILIRDHGDRSFYLCAIAFGLVVGGFRAWLINRSSESTTPA